MNICFNLLPDFCDFQWQVEMPTWILHALSCKGNVLWVMWMTGNVWREALPAPDWWHSVGVCVKKWESISQPALTPSQSVRSSNGLGALFKPKGKVECEKNKTKVWKLCASTTNPQIGYLEGEAMMKQMKCRVIFKHLGKMSINQTLDYSIFTLSLFTRQM